MKLFSWNIRGAGRKVFKTQLNKLIRTHNLDIIFLMESKVNLVRGKKIIQSLKIDNYDEVLPEGHSRGLWLL